MTIDEPMDLDAVVADDALVERLRRALSPEGAVVWDDDDDEEGDDLSYALLRALQRDVSADLEAAPLCAPEVVPLAARRRLLGRGATVAMVAAGVLSLAGAAAAAASSPGDPLYGVRSAVSSAVHDALDAVTPSEPVGPVTSAPTANSPTGAISPPGAEVSAAARSASAAVQIDERLTLAKKLVDAGRLVAADVVLDQAERRLVLVSDPALRSDFQLRLDVLRARIAAVTPSQGKPSDLPSPDKGQSASHRPSARPSHSAGSQRAPSASPGAQAPATTPDRRAEPKEAKPSVPVPLPAPADSARAR